MVVSPPARRKPSSTRIEHRAQMRTGILGAAGRLINRGGVDQLTMRTLGREVGVTAATLYGYFPSKEAVFEALLEEKTQAMNVALVRAAAGASAGAERLFAYAVGYREVARSSPDFYGMFIVKVEPPDWNRLASGEDQRSVVLYNLLQEIQVGIAAGDIYPISASAVCQVLWTVAHGYVTLERFNCLDTARLGESEQVQHFLEHMLLASKGVFTPDCQAALTEYVRTTTHAAGDDDKSGETVD